MKKFLVLFSEEIFGKFADRILVEITGILKIILKEYLRVIFETLFGEISEKI